jgi:hypothetical protein
MLLVEQSLSIRFNFCCCNSHASLQAFDSKTRPGSWVFVLHQAKQLLTAISTAMYEHLLNKAFFLISRNYFSSYRMTQCYKNMRGPTNTHRRSARCGLRPPVLNGSNTSDKEIIIHSCSLWENVTRPKAACVVDSNGCSRRSWVPRSVWRLWSATARVGMCGRGATADWPHHTTYVYISFLPHLQGQVKKKLCQLRELPYPANYFKISKAH